MAQVNNHRLQSGRKGEQSACGTEETLVLLEAEQVATRKSSCRAITLTNPNMRNLRVNGWTFPTMILRVDVLSICGSEEKRIRSLQKHTHPELQCRKSSPNLHTSVSAESLLLLCLVPARQRILNQLPRGDSFPSPFALILPFHKAQILQIHSRHSRSPA